MRPFKIILFVLFAVQYQGYCADVDGMFTAHINREIKLFVYDGLERVEVASTITDRIKFRNSEENRLHLRNEFQFFKKSVIRASMVTVARQLLTSLVANITFGYNPSFF